MIPTALEALKELRARVERAGWQYAHGSLEVVYVNDVCDWLDEFGELLTAVVSSPESAQSFAERELRMRLWMGHGHTGQYGDDGEMQCAQCGAMRGPWDYKRTPLEELVAHVNRLKLEQLKGAVVSSPESAQSNSRQIADRIVQAVAELPDLTSPDD